MLVISWRRGSWPGAGAATGTLLIDSAIARTGVCALWVFLLWNFAGYRPPVRSIEIWR
jgi:hypothetical protein